MTKRRIIFTLFILIFFLAASAGSLFAASFTVVGGGSSGLPEDNIYNPGPALFLPGSSTLFPFPIEVDAFSYGYVGIHPQSVVALQFSVDPLSVGAPATAVAGQSAAGEAEADIFSSLIGSGTNGQVFDGDGVPPPLILPAPPLGLIEPFDDVDGYDTSLVPTLRFIWWSVDLASGLLFAPPLGPADIIVTPIVPPPPLPYTFPLVPKTLFAPAAALGLGIVGADDIDALVVLEDGSGVGGPMSGGDCVLFSLTPGSATLAAIGAGPEDVLASGPGCPDPTGAVIPWVFAPGLSIGLLPGDNIDALDIYEDQTAIQLLDAQAQPASPGYFPWLAVVPAVMLSGAVVWRRRKQQLGET